MGEPDNHVTSLLRRWSAGDMEALEQLVPVVYDELRRLAHCHLRNERIGHTLQSTALVHEVYLRLCGPGEARFEDRAHFFAVAARAMRHVLVDYSRRRSARKRDMLLCGAPLERAAALPQQFDLAALDDALEQLGRFDARKCQVVEMRFFAGLRTKEIAAVLKTTEATVRRDWNIAKAWLYRCLEANARV
jgi:RNA polymerase sigma factor (TIGR02999 family)